jgi:hypothetical protein
VWRGRAARPIGDSMRRMRNAGDHLADATHGSWSATHSASPTEGRHRSVASGEDPRARPARAVMSALMSRSRSQISAGPVAGRRRVIQPPPHRGGGAARVLWVV